MTFATWNTLAVLDWIGPELWLIAGVGVMAYGATEFAVRALGRRAIGASPSEQSHP